MNGQLQDLQDKLQEKASQEQEVIKKIYEENLQKLSKDLQKSSARELYTMKNDTIGKIRKTSKRLKRESRIMSKAFAGTWLINLLLGIAIFSGVTLGLLYTMDWRTDSIAAEIEKLKHVKTAIQDHKMDIQRLLNKTEGAYLHKNSKGTYVVFPRGLDLNTYCEINDHPAIKVKK